MSAAGTKEMESSALPVENCVIKWERLWQVMDYFMVLSYKGDIEESSRPNHCLKYKQPQKNSCI
jgi:hypothetical protein